MARLLSKLPRALAFLCPPDGPPPVLRAVFKTGVDLFWTLFQETVAK
jgi:hypothetical protein